MLKRHGSPLIFEDQRAAKRVNNAIEEHGILLEDEDVEIDYFDTPMGEVDVNGASWWDNFNDLNLNDVMALKKGHVLTVVVHKSLVSHSRHSALVVKKECEGASYSKSTESLDPGGNGGGPMYAISSNQAQG
ncbi:hypothetical protein V6N11_058899 [Hibiscus sabdariffa]|uniref:Uncharacterized protein n=1 Tax=Hibiscus sabdariffa TaxID=183260 RepID=A0ABR2U5X7_9ROSI